MRVLEVGQSWMLQGNTFREGGEDDRKGFLLPGPLPGAVGWWGWGVPEDWTLQGGGYEGGAI